jgi:tetratricopeptide (TPR) repeat protein
MARVLILCQRAEELARALGDEGRIGRTSGWLFNVFWMMGQPREALAYANRAASAADAIDDRDLQLVSRINLAQLHLTSGDFREAYRVAQNGLELLKHDVATQHYSLRRVPVLRALLGVAYAALGKFDEGIVIGRAALREAEDTQHPFSISYAVTLLDRTYRVRGDFRECEALVDRTFALIDEHGLTLFLATAMARRGDNYVHSGRVAEGVVLLEQAFEGAKRKKVMYDLALIALFLGEGYLFAGRIEDAFRCAHESLRLARERAEQGYEAAALELLGDISSSCTPCDFESCSSHYISAMRLLEHIGMRPWLARCHLGLGGLYRRTGQRERAQEHLRTATTMLREMDMRYWLDKAETGLKELT